MLGHTNIQTTQIYARITNDKISKDMQGYQISLLIVRDGLNRVDRLRLKF